MTEEYLVRFIRGYGGLTFAGHTDTEPCMGTNPTSMQPLNMEDAKEIEEFLNDMGERHVKIITKKDALGMYPKYKEYRDSIPKSVTCMEAFAAVMQETLGICNSEEE